jgi:hypothetical protein
MARRSNKPQRFPIEQVLAEADRVAQERDRDQAQPAVIERMIAEVGCRGNRAEFAAHLDQVVSTYRTALKRHRRRVTPAGVRKELRRYADIIEKEDEGLSTKAILCLAATLSDRGQIDYLHLVDALVAAARDAATIKLDDSKPLYWLVWSIAASCEEWSERYAAGAPKSTSRDYRPRNPDDESDLRTVETHGGPFFRMVELAVKHAGGPDAERRGNGLGSAIDEALSKRTLDNPRAKKARQVSRF